MTVREAVPLSKFTTLRVGGPARYLIHVEHRAQLADAASFAKTLSLPITPLGEGSNVLACDAGYDGLVLRMEMPGIRFDAQTDGSVLVHAGAGVRWDDLVRESVARGLWGMENLAAIPGTVGAAPVQNIGAYGVECESIVTGVDVYDLLTGTYSTLSAGECGFRYRDSRFKTERNLLITAVTFRLLPHAIPQLSYSDLARVAAEGVVLDTPARVAEAVRSIRARKFPDLSQEGSAGSFFKNPLISEEEYRRLTEQFTSVIREYGAIPRYPLQDAGVVKIPLAYLLDKVLGLRGYRVGKAHLFPQQPLVLVTEHGATAHDVDALANDVAQKVFAATALTIEREVQTLK